MPAQEWVKRAILATALISLPQISVAQEANAMTPSLAPVFVQTMQVDGAAGTQSRQFFGRIAALETVDLSFEVGGHLIELNAVEGAPVTEGQVLAGLDLAPFERAVERAELSLAQAERDLTRLRTLASRSVASDVQAADAETARDLADVALREAREALEDARIHAPFDGLIAERVASNFVTIDQGQPVLRLHNMSEIRVEFDLPERLLTQIGDPAAASFTGLLSGSETEIPLSFREFQAETGQVGQSYTISLAVEGTPNALLLPGRTVIVRASIPAPQVGVTLPASAIATQPSGVQVAVAVEAGAAGLVARHIPIGVTSPTGTSFAVTGVEPGTEIVAVGAHMIADGQPLARYTGLTVEGN